MSKLTVKEILLAAAQTLNLDDAEAYLSGRSTQVGESNDLLRCYNLVENELALDYLPLYAEEVLQSSTGVIYYSTFDNAVVRVLHVGDEWDNPVEFKLFPDYMKTQPGVVKVRYTYSPRPKQIAEVCDYTLQASARLFVYGIAAEYTLAMGMFEESAVWDKKYKDAITAAYRARPSKTLRSRRWA